MHWSYDSFCEQRGTRRGFSVSWPKLSAEMARGAAVDVEVVTARPAMASCPCRRATSPLQVAPMSDDTPNGSPLCERAPRHPTLVITAPHTRPRTPPDRDHSEPAAQPEPRHLDVAVSPVSAPVPRFHILEPQRWRPAGGAVAEADNGLAGVGSDAEHERPAVVDDDAHNRPRVRAQVDAQQVPLLVIRGRGGRRG